MSAGNDLLRRAACLAGAVPGIHPQRRDVAFVAERQDWSIRWDGRYICDGVERLAPGSMRLTDRPYLARDKIVHYGSHYLWNAWYRSLPSGPRYVVTYFHGKPDDGPQARADVDRFMASLPKIACVVTAASAMEARLLDWGVPRSKLVRIALGVDTAHFTPPSPTMREAARKRFDLPADAEIVASFQKDGNGWGEGLEPKLIKGPDLFVAALARLKARGRPVMALLTGPARGYVKRGLEQSGVPYRHVYLDRYLDIVEAYRAADLYLMLSREEGGPKSILEAMASATPLVASDCGMTPDVVVSGVNGISVPLDDADAAADRAFEVLAGEIDRATLIAAGRRTSLDYDWSRIAGEYWTRVYEPLLQGQNPGAAAAPVPKGNV